MYTEKQDLTVEEVIEQLQKEIKQLQKELVEEELKEAFGGNEEDRYRRRKNREMEMLVNDQERIEQRFLIYIFLLQKQGIEKQIIVKQIIKGFTKQIERLQKKITSNPNENHRLSSILFTMGLASAYGVQANDQLKQLYLCYIANKEQNNDQSGIAEGMEYLAMLYRDQGKNDQLEQIYLCYIANKEQNNDQSGVANGMESLAKLYQAQDKYDQAESLFLRAIIHTKNANGISPQLASKLNNLALLYTAQTKDTQAILCYECVKAIYKFSYLTKTDPKPAYFWHNHFQESLMAAESAITDIKLQHERIKQEEDKRKALEAKNQELEATNKELELQIEETKKAYKIAHEKEKEMLSFFTHTMRNALATAPESLRQAIRLLGSEDYEKNKKQYKAINKIAALFSTLSLTDCLIDTFKQSINDPQEFKLAWQNDNTGDATPKWVIASALRQSLNRIIFMSDTSQLEKLLNVTATAAIVSMRKSFIESVLPLNVDHQGINTFYDWLNSINTIEISIKETNHSNFGVNQVKFSLLFATTSELILNALKYWDGTGNIQISWQLIDENYIFTVKNPCHENASSNLAGTHKGIAFIKRLMVLLGEQAQFNCSVEEQLFVAELKLHQSLFGA